MAIRTSLGAGRWRIARQLLTESVLLSTMGSALGLLLAEWSVRALRTLPPSNLPRAAGIHVDYTVMGFTAVLAFATGLLFGFMPALQNLRSAPAETLKEGGRTSSVGRHGMRSSLVVLETALALMLLIGSGLLLKSFLRLQSVDPGYQPKNLLTANVSLPGSKYKTDPQQTQFFEELLERLQNLNGVQAVGVASSNPLQGQGYNFVFVTKELAALAPSDQPSAGFYSVSPDYFRTLGIPLLTGRYFTPQDTAGALRVAIISQTVAKQFFRDRNPIGQQINIGNTSPEQGQVWREIIGVVGDVKDAGLDAGETLTVYEPCMQLPWSSMAVFLRTSGEPKQLAGTLRSKVLEMDKDQPVAAMATGEELMAEAVAQPQLRTLLLAVFAGIALVLAGFGVYGVMSNTVAQRTHEIGVRMALGAQQGSMLRLVIGHGLRLTLIGVVLGTAGGFLLTRLMKEFLFQVTPTDPNTFAAVAIFLVLVALLASYIPARRAMRVDPVVALRYE
jgi:putative ABC transport system permease protein